MAKNKKTNKEFESTLLTIQQSGIQADTAHIKQDMCAQFTDPNEWIREYVVNSYDAHATVCRIWSERKDDLITIYVLDDGHGMDKQGITDFCTLYRSRKVNKPGKTVGQFGIGKLSVAAIPGQVGFKVISSNEEECWIAEAGNLLSDDPIKIYRISEVPPKGTQFEITFSTKESQNVLMLKLSKILRKYTVYLPFTIEMQYPEDFKSGIPSIVERIGQDWSAASENYGRTYNILIHGNNYEVILGIGLATNEIYQNKVLVSDGYKLLSHDLKGNIQVPHFRIRVNSNAFELPFGRHCLRNEYVLCPISQKLRNEILPEYFNFLLGLYTEQPEKHSGLERDLEDMATALVMQLPDHNKKWCNIPLFRIYPDKRVSLVRLDLLVMKAGKAYLEENENTGADYSFFDAPILLQGQPNGSIAFLKECFKKELINLSLNDVVIEMPSRIGVKLTKEELEFQENLGLEGDLHKLSKKDSGFDGYDDDFGLGESDGFGLFGGRGKKSDYDSPEIKDAASAFRHLKWRVNYLVGRDGKSPCTTHWFIFSHNTVVLNLYHPEVQQLVSLSQIAPKLTGHWAVAMCMTENNRLLSFLSSESREDLLLADAMMKISTAIESKDDFKAKDFKKMRKSMRDLLKNSGFDFGSN